MNPNQDEQPDPDLPLPQLSALRINPSSPSPSSSLTPTAAAQRRIAIAVDLSDESAYAVKWAVSNYLRPGDAVILLHVRPTSILYGADWGSIKPHIDSDKNTPIDEQKLEDDFANFTTSKAKSLAQPLVDADIPFKIHIVKDHDMKERLCLEVERLGLSAVIMGSRGFGASRRSSIKGRLLGSVSDYCVQHCICPVVVVRCPHDNDDNGEDADGIIGEEAQLHPVPEEEEEDDDGQQFHDASDVH
ncbi:universal stress protein PHOS32-like [Mercurialis annua]|uniref:universal stress protein PHOS32-like n=1 Tax=Mercurialis annua TaxID=3986 RepID=UPI00215E4172|nr:universal stress protein PHOS32-like [Mercurialis annua]